MMYLEIFNNGKAQILLFDEITAINRLFRYEVTEFEKKEDMIFDGDRLVLDSLHFSFVLNEKEKKLTISWPITSLNFS